MSNKNTCAVVVTYNRLTLLKECLQALQRQTMDVKHIVVYDNASDDGTKEYLDSVANEQIIVFHSDSNLGGAGGFSNGLKTAYERTNDQYFWLMDDDTIVADDCNEVFLKKAQLLDDQFGFLSTNVRWKDGTPTNVMLTDSMWPNKVDDGLIEMEYGSFVSFFITRYAVEEIGLPISEFFIWGDDSDYSLRLRHVNPGYFVIQAHAVHKSGSNVVAPGVAEDNESRINRYYYYYRNQMYIWKHHYGKYWKLFFKYTLQTFLILKKAKNHKLQRFLIVFKGLFASLTFNPEIVKVKIRK